MENIQITPYTHTIEENTPVTLYLDFKETPALNLKRYLVRMHSSSNSSEIYDYKTNAWVSSYTWVELHNELPIKVNYISESVSVYLEVKDTTTGITYFSNSIVLVNSPITKRIEKLNAGLKGYAFNGSSAPVIKSDPVVLPNVLHVVPKSLYLSFVGGIFIALGIVFLYIQLRNVKIIQWKLRKFGY
ncbi:MAG: hypothetical protein R3B92_02660 [Patescibacteria group bacterium]|uniref:Uncharacterized protein n=1 Tax=candidate division WWE3 bacterium TaxID=2053526 RepID=A0A955ED87_UNCKA|nr:hypothetical protein [candidate division WWE3 bacterium]